MNDKRISELPHLTESKDTDIVPVVDTEDSTTKQQTKGEFLAETEDRQYFTEERAREAVESEGYLKEVGWSEVKEKPATFPPSAHTHPIDQVTGLQNALDEKANSADLGTMAFESADNYYDKGEIGVELGNKANQSALTSHTSNTDNPHSVTKAQVGLGKVDNTSDADKPVSNATQLALNAKLDANLKGAANGVAELDASGHVPASQLPSYVDDVLEFDSLGDFPATGEPDKIYIAVDTNQIYRWSGSQYVQISSSLALGETAQTAYRGDRGKIAYDHSQTSGNPHGTTKADIGLGNVDNTPDDEKPVSNPQASALAGKEPTINAGAVGDYFTGSKTWASLADAVRAVKLAGFTIINSVVDAGDSILAAFGKLQGQINAISSALGGKANTADLKDMAYEDDAPNDGKQYAREDGAWTEVTVGGSSSWEDNAELDGGIKYEGGNLLVGDSMEGAGTKMFFNSAKGAFRAGVTGTQWNDANVGFGSFAGGNSAAARNAYSFAFGSNSTRAFGDNSFAFGNQAFADSVNSVAIGAFTHTTVHSMIAFGRYNMTSGNFSSWISTDPLFVIGNGTNGFTRSNALTLLKNATLGINTHEPDLSSILDLQATDRGFLPPRMTEVQRDAIATPAEGLVVYNTDTKKLNLFDGTSWEVIG